jgi:pyrroloquinoline-quinone synthase
MTDDARLSPEAFLDRLRAEGRRRYHDKHPFHKRMHEGRLSRRQIQAWVENRYYYQTRIPIKDALILSKSDDPAFRRLWLRRIVDHDGEAEGQGGLAEWHRLAEAVGLDPAEVRSLQNVLPAVRFACDAYVALVRERSLAEAVAASLTELFSPELMAQRIDALKAHYTWIDPAALAYFSGRVPRAARDAREAIDLVVRAATTREMQERCASALITKCEILWSLLDAVDAAYPDAAEGQGSAGS